MALNLFSTFHSLSKMYQQYRSEYNIFPTYYIYVVNIIILCVTIIYIYRNMFFKDFAIVEL